MIHGYGRRSGGASGRLLLTTALLSGCVSMPLWAQDATWSGAVSNDFSETGNWIEGALPEANGTAFFEGVAEGASGAVNLGTTRTVGAVSVNDIEQISGGIFVFENDTGAAQLTYRDADANALADSLRLDLNGQALAIVGETEMTFGGGIFNGGGPAAELNLSVADGATMNLSGAISNGLSGGPLSVVVSSGQVTLSGTNTYTAGTIVSGGTLTLANENALNDQGNVVLDGTLALQDVDQTIGALSGGGAGQVALNGQTLTVSGGEASRFDGTLNGDGAIVVSNETALTLGGNNSGFQGGLTAQDDATLIGMANGFGTGDIRLQTDGGIAGAENMTLGNNITVATSGGVIAAAPGTQLNLTGSLERQGDVVFGNGTDGGVIVLDNSAITGGGGATIAADTEVRLSSEQSAALLDNGLEVDGVLDFGTVGGDADGLTGTGLVRFAPNEQVTLELTGTETFSGGFAEGEGGLVTVDVDPGTGIQVTLQGSGSTYSGATQVQSGRLVVRGGDAVSNNSTVVIADAATFDLGNSENVGGLAGTGAVDLNANTLGIVGGSNGQFDGVVSGSGRMAFDLEEGSTFTLNSSGNVFGGATEINSGTLFVDGGGAIGDQSEVTIGAAGALNVLANERVRTLNNAGTLVLGGNTLTVGSDVVNNTGVINLSDAAQLTAPSLVNSDSLNVSGTSRIDGDLINTETGTIAMAGNGVAGDRLEVSGDAQLNGVVTLDFALSQGAVSGDQIAVEGVLDGNVTLVFSDLSTDTGTISEGVPVLTYGSLSPDFTFSQNTLPSSGAVVYALGLDEATNSLEIRSAPNPAVAGISAGLTLTQSLINTVVNRPTSPFVAGLAAEDDKPCGVGAWARGTGGSANATGATQTSIGAFESEIEAQYAGLQFGFDFSCFDGRYAGFDLSFGAIAGVNQGSLSQPVFRFDTASLSQDLAQQTSSNETDFTQTYAGAYIGASRGRLFADVQLRFDRTKFDLVNVALVDTALNGLADDIGVADQEYDSKSTTISGSVGYAFPLNEEGSLNFVPAIGVALSTTSVDDLRFDGGTPDTPEDDGLLQIEDIDSKVAFLSATLSRSKVLPSGMAALNYFGTVTYYQDFGSDTTSRFFEVDALGAPVGDPLTTTSSNLGSYTELSVGLNYTKLIEPGRAAGARQFDASVRLDGRFSGGLDGYGVTAQMRYQF